MHILKEHIIYKILSFTLALALLLPGAIKLSHAFNHYKHEVCLGEKTTHFHKTDVNCKFYDFKLTKNYMLSEFNFNASEANTPSLKIVSQYLFLSTYQNLHFSLRGPPSIV